ncbi:Wzz/FepE/Etk N-terminal domain-containing protein [Metallumcola ferriviriculae]|uniref:Wzz/FepE/Etk N-terminal domain-containing protein n=1 Tax=Metallumcola ferriviriculae TaxID=3039180 RepID=A0AAU0UL36_9FIRM|nr:Wzz/FepE/Etk N-terminal domain-containing protein [Desulfitibacteraceae bacterium MK1]
MATENEMVKIQIIDLRSLFKVLVKRKWIIILGVLLAILISVSLNIYVFNPVYEARVLLRVSHPVQSIRDRIVDNQGLEAVVSSMSQLPEMTMQTHVRLLTSDALMQRVRDNLGIGLEDIDLKTLLKLTDVSVIKDSNLILLKTRFTKPTLAKTLGDTISIEYIKFVSEINQQQMEQSITFLKDQYALIETDLYSALGRLSKVNNTAGTFLSLEGQVQKTNLMNEVSRLQQTMDLLAEKIAENRISGSMDFGQASILVVSPASLPLEPIRPRKILNIVIAFFLGLLVFIPLAFLLEHLDYKIKTPNDVADHLVLPTLGMIPQIKRDSISID